MIEFTCEHCGSPARFPDSHAGKHGRCPSCGRLVTVPPKPSDNVADLAAALQEKSEADTPVPPPPQLYEPSLEELELGAVSKDPFSETDIIPTDQILDSLPAERKAIRRAARAARKLAAAACAGADRSKRVATFTAIAVMLLLIAIVYALLILRSLL